MEQTPVIFRSEKFDAWLAAPLQQRIIAVLSVASIEPIFVGGCVRDILLGRPSHDLDIRVTASLQQVVESLEIAGLPCDIEAGDIGLIGTQMDETPVDIISLPAWLAYKGINAQGLTREEMIGQWMADSDFTINSLALLPDGTAYNYHHALEDLAAGRIRFVSDDVEASFTQRPDQIIRFIRFQALFGQELASDDIYALFRKHAHLLETVEPVRMQYPMNLILASEKPYAMLEQLHRYGILRYILGFDIIDCELIAALEQIEAVVCAPAQPSVRLLLLLTQAQMLPERALALLFERWDFSEGNRQILTLLLEKLSELEADSDEATLARLMQELGGLFPSLVLSRWALEPDVKAAASSYQPMLESYRAQKAASA